MNRKYPIQNLMGMAILAVLFLALILSRPALAAEDPWPKRFDASQGHRGHVPTASGGFQGR